VGGQLSKLTPKRFTGLHAHSGFSTFDGLGYPQEHIDYILENGMNAWALTEHGHMNSFGHAYFHSQKLRKKGIDFKFIPGCEMYVHPDLDVWRLDHQISAAAKKGDKDAIRTLREQREKIVTPLTALVDADDDIVGIEVDREGFTVENEEESKSGKFYDPVKRRHHLVVLPRTPEGLNRLFHLVSRGYSEGFYRFPRVDYKMLKEASEGGHLLVSTACIGGPAAYEVFKHLQNVEFDHLSANLYDTPGLSEKVLRGIGNVYDRLTNAVGRDAAFLELQFNRLPAQHLVNRALLDFAKQNGVEDKLIVTCDSHYSRPEHWREREIYKNLGWLNYRDMDPDKLPTSRDDLKCELYPKNAKQIWETYQDQKHNYDFYDDAVVCDAVERTYDIAHHMIGDIHPDTSMKLPDYVVPENMTEDDALLEACKRGLVERGLHKDPQYIDRLKTELVIIKQKSFSKYFLTMKAIMDIARDNMLIGPGRGSAAGSLVAYVLGITNIDPIEYGLLFSRFLSVHRQGAPDIDSDVADRDHLIDLLKQEFGGENIVPISNYNTFKLKSLVKDISRFYGIPFDEANRALAPVENDVKKAIFTRGMDKNMFVLLYEDAYKHSPTFRAFIDKYPEVAGPIQILFKQNKSLGKHAGGCIISERIAERMPLIRAKGEMQTPWVEGMNYKHLESLGWIKFDLLGLETLRIIQRTIELVLQRKEGIENPTFEQVRDWFDKHMDPKIIDMNDQRVYKNVYEEGRFPGVFQLAGRGARRLFMKAQPKNIIDIATLTSVYRPGPLAAKVDKLYITAKSNPDQVDYGHPLIKEVLESTYGMIIFQEQIMQLCSVVAGFPEEDTDQVRRGLLKRKASEKEANLESARKLQKRFVGGSVSNGVPRKIASDLYEKILYFAGYGFNKAHAVSYAVDSYYCAWLLTHYEEEWLCAYLEASSSNPKKRAKAIGELKGLGYEVVPIDVNYASTSWTILPGKKFMPSFLACKAVGTAAAREIVASRPYTCIEDLLWNEDGTWKHKKFNKGAMAALIKARAFDSLGVVGQDCVFENYRQFYDVVIDNYADLRKRKKTDPGFAQRVLREASLEAKDSPGWTPAEIATNYTGLFGAFSALDIVKPALIERLREKGIMSIDDVTTENDVYWFIVCKATPKKTKRGSPYLLLEVIGESGMQRRMFCWGWDGQTNVPPYSFAYSEAKTNDFGTATKWKRMKYRSLGA